MMILLSVLLPVLGAAAAGTMGRKTLRRWVITGVMVLELPVLLLAGGSQLAAETALGLSFRLEADGLGLLFAVLFALMFLCSGIFGFEYLHEGEGRYYGFYLLTLASLVGLCFAGNLLTFYMFYELMTVLSFPLVLHEGTPASVKAAKKYLGYSLFGAALALLGFFIMGAWAPGTDFVPGGVLSGGENRSLLLWASLALLIGFGGKAGLMPLQDWLPTAHPQAPAPASAVLSGVITKAGVLGIIRVSYYLCGADFLRGSFVQMTMLVLSLTTVFCGSMLAYKEKILKKRLAYSTVSQVSYVVFGLMLLCELGFQGALLQAVFHAAAKVCLFLCAGAVICKTGKTRVEDLWGWGRQMPLVVLCFAFAGLSLVGIPPFAGFVSKWYLAQGALSQFPVWGWVGAAVLLISALLTAGYLLPPVSAGFFPGEEVQAEPVKIGLCIRLPLAVLAAGVLLLGLFPGGLMAAIARVCTAVGL